MPATTPGDVFADAVVPSPAVPEVAVPSQALPADQIDWVRRQVRALNQALANRRYTAALVINGGMIDFCDRWLAGLDDAGRPADAEEQARARSIRANFERQQQSILDARERETTRLATAPPRDKAGGGPLPVSTPFNFREAAQRISERPPLPGTTPPATVASAAPPVYPRCVGCDATLKVQPTRVDGPWYIAACQPGALYPRLPTTNLLHAIFPFDLVTRDAAGRYWCYPCLYVRLGGPVAVAAPAPEPERTPFHRVPRKEREL